MDIPGWKYYNHAAIPTCAPHETPNLTPLKDGSIWHIEGKRPLLARWTTDWDCGKDTGWWAVIKDTPYDITGLKSNDRYKINKARKYFEFKEINPCEYKDELLKVQIAAFSAYPAKYRPTVNKENFIKSLEVWQKEIELGHLKVFGSFFKETGELCGYIYAIAYKEFVELTVQKTKPAFEKYQVNASLVDGMLTAYSDKLGKGLYIYDGMKSINHETHFQDYLEKYFGFRKAYCRIHIAYPRMMRLIMNFFSPFCRLIDCLGSKIRFLHLFASLLKMNNLAKKSSKEGAIK